MSLEQTPEVIVNERVGWHRRRVAAVAEVLRSHASLVGELRPEHAEQLAEIAVCAVARVDVEIETQRQGLERSRAR